MQPVFVLNSHGQATPLTAVRCRNEGVELQELLAVELPEEVVVFRRPRESRPLFRLVFPDLVSTHGAMFSPALPNGPGAQLRRGR